MVLLKNSHRKRPNRSDLKSQRFQIAWCGFEIARFKIAAIWAFTMQVFLAKPSNFIVFFTPMDPNAIFQPWSGVRERPCVIIVLIFCNIYHACSWYLVPKDNCKRETQERGERDVQASFEGVANEREELSFLSSPVRLTLDSYAFCTTIWGKLSLGSRTASGLGCIDALLEQSG